MPRHSEVAPGKLPLSSPVPCQLSVQPPDWRAMSSAPSPATRICACGLSGRTPVFLRRTSDLRTASRATARCSGAPSNRSEEHTSELQSLMRISYAVFRLKNKNKKQHAEYTKVAEYDQL